MADYERVTYSTVPDPDGKATVRTIILRDPHLTTFSGVSCLSGVHVNREGDEVVPNKSVHEVVQVIEETLIARRSPLAFSRKYGWLVSEAVAAAEREATLD